MLKKLIIVIILSIFCFGFTIQDMHKRVIAIKNTSVSCSTANDSQQWVPTSQCDSFGTTNTWSATEFTIASQITVTGYLIDLRDNSGGDTGSTRVVVVDDSGGEPDETSEISGSAIQVACTSIPNSYEQYFFELASPLVLPSGTYWVIIQEIDSAVLNTHYCSTSTGDARAYSDNGTTWTVSSGQSLDVEIWGCN